MERGLKSSITQFCKIRRGAHDSPLPPSGMVIVTLDWIESKDIDGAGGEQGDDCERNQRLEHGAELCPAGEYRGVRG